MSTTKATNNDLNISRIALVFTLVPGAYVVMVASVLLAVLIGTGLIYGIGYIMITYFHRVPVGVIILLGLGILYTILAVIYALIKSIIIKPQFKPALLIKHKEIELLEFVKGICDRMGTEPPSSIMISADPEFFVTQSKIRCLNGVSSGRALAIGLPILGSLTINEFRAILCHEFAHFTGNDTIYSKFVLPAYISLQTASTQMQAIINGDSDDNHLVSIPMLLPCWSLELCLKRFHTLNMNISRAREHGADAIATYICGSYSFSRALTDVLGK